LHARELAQLVVEQNERRGASQHAQHVLRVEPNERVWIGSVREIRGRQVREVGRAASVLLELRKPIPSR
jgi:hypothetical protein